MKLSRTDFDNVNNLLEELLLQLKVFLKDDCLGVYLYGSLAW